MDYKLIALDMDGTLLNDEKVITEKTKNALIKAQQQGVKVVISTGRMYMGIKKYAQQLQLDKFGGYAICFNGGLILDSKGDIISKEYLPKKYLKMACEETANTDITVIVHSWDKLHGTLNNNPFTEIAPKTVGLPLIQTENLYDYVDWDIHKILLVGEHTDLEQLKNRLDEKYKDELEIVFSYPWFVEITPKGVDKAKGLKAICDKINIDISETIACGDSFNDKAMIKTAGLGVIMKNGVEELKSLADYVTENDCNNNGIAEVLEKFVLK